MLHCLSTRDRSAHTHAARKPVRLLAGTAIAAAAGLKLLCAPALAAPFPLGVYIGNPDNSNAQNEALFEANYASFTGAMNAAPALMDVYIDYTQAVANWPGNSQWDAASHAASPVARTMQPVIGFPMYSTDWGSPSPDQQFQAFASGQYDAQISGIVKTWVQNGGVTNLIFRLGWEMNLSGSPYYVGNDAQSQQDWVAAFQHIHDVLKQAGATYGAAITIVWNPGTSNYAQVSATQNLWPGDNYVDIVGIDVYSDMYPYSDGGNPPQYHDWDTGGEDDGLQQFMADPINRHHYWTWPAADKWALNGSEGHSETFMQLMHFALNHGKPLAVCETGAGNSNGGTDVTDDPTFPAWLSQALNRAMALGANVAFVNIWDSNGGGNYEFSYPGDNKPQESASWQNEFGN
jgi:hypothetical protein